jgi:ABC-type nitrate/sulfonate/bicarbonate transport system substrate-binding protein
MEMKTSQSGVSRVIMAAGHHHFSHRAAPLCAAAKGFFKDEGLADLAITATGEDERTIEGLKQAKIHFGLDVAPYVVLPANAKGESLFIIGSLTNDLHFILIGIKSLKSVEDLRGKRIHVVESGGGVDARHIRVVLRQRGLNPDKDVTLVPHGPFPLLKNAIASFEKGECDARLVFYREIQQVIAAGYPVLHDFAETYPNGYPERVMVTTGEIIDKYPELIKSFLRGIIRGYRFIRKEENYAEVMEIARGSIKEKNLGCPAGLDPADLERQYYALRQVPADGNITKKGLQQYIDEEISAGGLPKTFTMEQIARLSFVEAVARELDEKFGPEGYL